MYDSWGVRKQPFVGKIRLQRCSGEKDQRRVASSVVQTDLNICLQTVLIAKPLAAVLHLVTVHFVQTELTEFPASEEKPRDGCACDYSRSDYAEVSPKGIRRNMFCR